MEAWFVVALIAPFLWACVAVLDSHFVKGWYRNEYDAVVVSGLFQSFPLVLIPLNIVEFSFPQGEEYWFAVGAGLVFIGSFYCYFLALFHDNDSVLAQTVWNFSVPLVPFLGWMLFGEVLAVEYYVGVIVALAGILILVFYQKVVREIHVSHFFLPMFGAVLLLSLSMILAKKAYATSDFLGTFLVFCGSASIGSVSILAFRYSRYVFRELRGIITLIQDNFFWFLLSEGLSLVATIASQRALSLAPSATPVAVIESLVPIFIMLISILGIWWYRFRDHEEEARFESVLLRQVVGGRLKLCATLCMLFATALVA